VRGGAIRTGIYPQRSIGGVVVVVAICIIVVVGVVAVAVVGVVVGAESTGYFRAVVGAVGVGPSGYFRTVAVGTTVRIGASRHFRTVVTCCVAVGFGV